MGRRSERAKGDSPLQARPKRRFVVRGHYCPTDCNPQTDARDAITERECGTRVEARAALLWFPGGKIIERKGH